jgi:hypothetical protein
LEARRRQRQTFIVPLDDAAEAAVVEGVDSPLGVSVAAPKEGTTANDPSQVRSQKLVAHSQPDLVDGFEVSFDTTWVP